MKHGPNALIDENLPVVVIATCDRNDELSKVRYEKTISNLKEVKARSGKVIAIATEGDEEIEEAAPRTLRARGPGRSCCRSWRSCRCNCWRTTLPFAADATLPPRNLAKSVTVE